MDSTAELPPPTLCLVEETQIAELILASRCRRGLNRSSARCWAEIEPTSLASKSNGCVTKLLYRCARGCHSEWASSADARQNPKGGVRLYPRELPRRVTVGLCKFL